MAHFTRTRADLTAWTATSTVDDTEFNDLDEKTFKAINGDEGGTWAPSSVIEIGGSGLLMSALATFNGQAAFNGSVNFTDHLGVSAGGSYSFGAEGSFSAKANFNSDVDLGDDSGDVITVAGTMTCNAPVTFNGLATHAVTTNFDGGVNLNSITTINGPLVLNSSFIPSGTGRIRQRIEMWSNDSNYVANPWIDHLVRLEGSMTANRTVTIDDAQADDGDTFWIHNHNNEFSVLVNSTVGSIEFGVVHPNTSQVFGRHAGTWSKLSQQASALLN